MLEKERKKKGEKKANLSKMLDPPKKKNGFRGKSVQRAAEKKRFHWTNRPKKFFADLIANRYDSFFDQSSKSEFFWWWW